MILWHRIMGGGKERKIAPALNVKKLYTKGEKGFCTAKADRDREKIGFRRWKREGSIYSRNQREGKEGFVCLTDRPTIRITSVGRGNLAGERNFTLPGEGESQKHSHLNREGFPGGKVVGGAAKRSIGRVKILT